MTPPYLTREETRAKLLALQAMQFAKQGKYDQAVESLSRAIALDPNWGTFYYHRGEYYASQGKYDQAIADYTRAIELGFLKKYWKDYFYFAGRVKLNLPIFGKKLNAVYISRGTVYLKQAKYEQALTDFNRAIALKADDPSGYICRGLAYTDQGKFEQAMTEFNRAVALDPQFFGAYHNRGLVHMKQGKHEQAIADLARAIELNPRDVDAYLNLGTLFDRSQRFLDALKNYRNYLELARENVDPFIVQRITDLEILKFEGENKPVRDDR